MTLDTIKDFVKLTSCLGPKMMQEFGHLAVIKNLFDTPLSLETHIPVNEIPYS